MSDLVNSTETYAAAENSHFPPYASVVPVIKDGPMRPLGRTKERCVAARFAAIPRTRSWQRGTPRAGTLLGPIMRSQGAGPFLCGAYKFDDPVSVPLLTGSPPSAIFF